MSRRPWRIPTLLPAPDEIPSRVWAWLSLCEKGVGGSTDPWASGLDGLDVEFLFSSERSP